MTKLDEKFLQEALSLLNDNDIRLGMLAKYRLKSYAEEYSKKIKDDPETAKKILQKIHRSISKVLGE